MRFYKLTLALLLFLLSLGSNGQVAGILPGQENIKFHKLEYRTSTIYLNELEQFTGVDLPNSIKIEPPNLLKFENVVVLVGIVEGMDPESIIICLAGNSNTEKVTYFIDRNNDRNFLNDGPAVKIRSWDDTQQIALNGNSEIKKLVIMPPRVRKKSMDPKIRIEDKLSLSISLGVGFGDLKYHYDNLDNIFQTKYSAEINEQNISTALSYDFKRFNLGISATFQNHHYATSHLDVRKGRPLLVRNGLNGALEDRNLSSHTLVDEHPKNRIQLGFFGTYKKRLSQTVDIQARLTIGTTKYFNQTYSFFYKPELDNLVPHQATEYSYGGGTFYEISIRSEITMGINQVLFLELARNQLQWEPEGFLNDLPQRNFDSKLLIVKMNAGYRFAF